MHRDHSSARRRAAGSRGPRPTDVDRFVEAFRSTVLPAIEAAEGFCSASMFVDRRGGRTCATVTFDSRPRSTRPGSRRPCCATARGPSTGIEFNDVAEFDLVLAHLRVPELV